jgi:hypothetical protein
MICRRCFNCGCFIVYNGIEQIIVRCDSSECWVKPEWFLSIYWVKPWRPEDSQRPQFLTPIHGKKKCCTLSSNVESALTATYLSNEAQIKAKDCDMWGWERFPQTLLGLRPPHGLQWDRILALSVGYRSPNHLAYWNFIHALSLVLLCPSIDQYSVTVKF